MHKTPKECLKALVNSLSLAISLGMISGSHVQRDSSQPEQLSPQIASKDLVSITDNSSWHPM